MARKLVVQIVGDDRSLQAALGRASTSTTRFGGALRSVGKAAAFTAGGVAFGGLVVALKRGSAEFADSQKVALQTRAVLRSTGKAAHVTAKQVDELATAISNKSGIDDETVKSGENLLLTFTKIRNETGKGNKIFDQATQAITDMSVALGQDMKQSAIQLGKALNDPINGVTALRRVGVSFTQAQRDQIKALVESGRVMQAQKVILRELKVEFGGSADAAGKTFAGQLNKLRNSIDNVAGSIVGAVAPAIQQWLERVNAWLAKGENQKRLTDAITNAARTMRDVIASVVAILTPLVKAANDAAKAFGGWNTVLKVFIGLAVASKIRGVASSLLLVQTNAAAASKGVGGLKKQLGLLPSAVTVSLIIDTIVQGAVSDHPAHGFPGSKIANRVVKAVKGVHGVLPLVPAQIVKQAVTGGGGGGNRANVLIPQTAVFTGDIHVTANDPHDFLSQLQREADRRTPARRGRGAGTGKLRFG